MAAKFKLDSGIHAEMTDTTDPGVLKLYDPLTGNSITVTEQDFRQLNCYTLRNDAQGILIPGPIWEPAPADQPPEELPH